MVEESGDSKAVEVPVFSLVHLNTLQWLPCTRSCICKAFNHWKNLWWAWYILNFQ